MQMKSILPLLLLFITSFAMTQQQQQEQPKDTIVYEYTPRWFNPSFCGCPPPRTIDTTTIKKDSLKLPPVTFYREQKKPGHFAGL